MRSDFRIRVNHAEITRLVHAVAELGRVSFAHQRWTAEVRRRKKARGRREEDALIASDLQEIRLDPHDDDSELDAELAQFTMDETQVPADEQEPADLNALPSRPSPSMKTDSLTQPSKFVSGPRYIGFTAAHRSSPQIAALRSDCQHHPHLLPAIAYQTAKFLLLVR
jgi:hypothetical protein